VYLIITLIFAQNKSEGAPLGLAFAFSCNDMDTPLSTEFTLPTNKNIGATRRDDPGKQASVHLDNSSMKSRQINPARTCAATRWVPWLLARKI
jgi:hypothetical protein